MQVQLTMVSNNRKVGPVPVSTVEKDSCPNSCPLRDTDCYARFGPLGIHWKKVSKGDRGGNWDLFCRAVARFWKGQPWRHAQAGDAPKDKELSDDKTDRIDRDKFIQLGKAAKHTKGWTYTHYDMEDQHNAEVVRDMNKLGGLVVNMSADSLTQADTYYQLGVGPVATILPKDAPSRGNKTPGGVPITICPAQEVDDMSCARCMLCQKKDRKVIVGFRAHGTASKRLSKKLEGAI